MSLDRRYNPVTRDYVDSPSKAGAFDECEVLENQIALSFAFARGSWEGGPEMGHRLGELARATDTLENRQRARDLCIDAVQWLIDDGSLSKAECTVESFAAGVVAFQLDAYPPNATVPLQLPTFLISVGGSP